MFSAANLRGHAEGEANGRKYVIEPRMDDRVAAAKYGLSCAESTGEGKSDFDALDADKFLHRLEFRVARQYNRVEGLRRGDRKGIGVRDRVPRLDVGRGEDRLPRSGDKLDRHLINQPEGFLGPGQAALPFGDVHNLPEIDEREIDVGSASRRLVEDPPNPRHSLFGGQECQDGKAIQYVAGSLSAHVFVPCDALRGAPW